MCVSLFAYDESADVVYSADSLSAEVKIGSAYFDGGEHFVRFYLPQNYIQYQWQLAYSDNR